MKVLVTTDVFPPDIGGPATFVPALATALAQRGHEVTVVTWSHLASHADDRRYAFRLERIRRWRSRTLRLARMLPRLLAHARRADVIFVNGLLFAAWLGNAIARRPMIAKVVGDLAWEYAQAHGIVDDLETFGRRRYRVSVEWRRRLQSAVLRRLDAVVVPSAYLAGLVRSWGVAPGRIHVIANALNPGGAPPQPSGRGDRNRRLVTVGRLTAHKRVDEIIEVLPALSGVDLLVIGDGPQRTALEAGARALPHAVLEAFAAGIPVVATAVGGTPELVRDGESGVLVPPGDAKRLREAIQTLLDDAALRERLGRGGYAVLLERHSMSAMVDATEALLARVSGRRAAAFSGIAR